MALTKDPDELWLLSLGWEEARNDALFAAEQIEESILTRWYRKTAHVGSSHEPRNRSFGYMALLLPHLVQSSPKWRAESDGTIVGEMVAEGNAAALSQLHRRQEMHRTLRPCAWDYGIAWAGAYVDFTAAPKQRISKKERQKLRMPLGIAGASTPTPNMFELPGMPRVTPLDRRRWGWDSTARTWPEVRAFFHDATYDIEQLEEMALLDQGREGNWKTDVIDRLAQETDWKRLGYAGSVYGPELAFRRQVVVRQFWVPEAELQRAPEDGEHGVIYTVIQLGDGKGKSGAQFIRDPFYWKGHHTGPYAYNAQYQPSSSTFPLTRLLAAKDSTDMVNALAVASGRRMMRARRVYLADGAVYGEAKKAAQTPDGHILGVDGMFATGQPLMVPVDFGGLGAQDIQMMQWAIADNDESLAMLAAQRGATGQSNNATEVAVAAQAYESGLGYVVQGWDGFVESIGTKCAHLVHTNTRFFMHLDREGKERLRDLQVQQAITEGLITPEEGREVAERLRGEPTPWQGGDADGFQSEYDPESVGVRLEPYSMGGRGEQEVRFEEAELNARIFELAQQQAATPWMDLTPRFRALGEAYGRPGIERMIDKAKRDEFIAAANIEQPAGQYAGFGPAKLGGGMGPIVRESAGTSGTRRPGPNGALEAANAGGTQGPASVGQGRGGGQMPQLAGPRT